MAISLEYKFGDLDKATRKLNGLGFSLNKSVISERLYYVLPSEMRDDYPTREDGKTPRSVALLFSSGTLIIPELYDKNPILMAYQETLREVLIAKIKR